MSGWEQPHPRQLQLSEPSAVGRDLGFINPKHFESATWEPLLKTDVGRRQYCKFVAAMIERIRAQESSCDEVKSFVRLVVTEHNWDFLKVASPYLPELREQYPKDPKNFEMALLFVFLKPVMRDRDIGEIQHTTPPNRDYANGLSWTEELFLRQELFGPDRGAVDSQRMNRLFESTLELGYPLVALHRSMREAVERGTDIERYPNGLPANLHLPSQSDRFGLHQFQIQDTSEGATPSTVTSSADTLQGEQRVADGLSPSILTNLYPTRTSEAELPALDNWQQVGPRWEGTPPRITQEEAERAGSRRSSHSGSGIEFPDWCWVGRAPERDAESESGDVAGSKRINIPGAGI